MRALNHGAHIRVPCHCRNIFGRQDAFALNLRVLPPYCQGQNLTYSLIMYNIKSMSLSDVFLFLYPIVPLVGLMGFVPQIIAIIKTDTALRSFSISTWLMWLSTWCISFGYGALCIQDMLFCITCAMNIIAHVFIIALVFVKRRNNYRTRKLPIDMSASRYRS